MIAVLALVGYLGGRRFLSGADGEPQADPPRDSTAAVPVVTNRDGLDPAVDEAISQAVARVRREPGGAEAYGELGRIYHAHTYNDLARRSYETAHRLAPQTADWPYYLGLLAADRGDYEVARQRFVTVLRLQPDYLPAANHLGDAHLALGRISDAEQSFSRIVAERPEEPWGYLGLARVERRRLGWIAAAGHLERALDLDPQNYEAAYLLAMTLRELGREPEAADLLSRLTGLKVRSLPDPLLEQALNKRSDLQRTIQVANRLVVEGNWQEAEVLYTSVLATDPEHYDALYNLALLYARAGRSDEAHDLMERAVKVRPDHADAYFLLAMTLVTQGEFEKAAPHAERALELDPDHADARDLLHRLRAAQPN